LVLESIVSKILDIVSPMFLKEGGSHYKRPKDGNTNKNQNIQKKINLRGLSTMWKDFIDDTIEYKSWHLVQEDYWKEGKTPCLTCEEFMFECYVRNWECFILK